MSDLDPIVETGKKTTKVLEGLYDHELAYLFTLASEDPAELIALIEAEINERKG